MDNREKMKENEKKDLYSDFASELKKKVMVPENDRGTSYN